MHDVSTGTIFTIDKLSRGLIYLTLNDVVLGDIIININMVKQNILCHNVSTIIHRMMQE